ncbi:hypothetical protein E2C01_001750 [Portunus trituberculatus]|uniref:Uncharacterized protein n=1 Tax=Portunus trituberculatus TaxID=210409 RepID=A0A5B7CIU9_PORTR|nr:hypothetical protein [Portunus trituberculatus]
MDSQLNTLPEGVPAVLAHSLLVRCQPSLTSVLVLGFGHQLGLGRVFGRVQQPSAQWAQPPGPAWVCPVLIERLPRPRYARYCAKVSNERGSQVSSGGGLRGGPSRTRLVVSPPLTPRLPHHPFPTAPPAPPRPTAPSHTWLATTPAPLATSRPAKWFIF